MRRVLITGAMTVAAAAAGCSNDGVSSKAQSLDAYCSAMVIGTGIVDVETDYIPHVVQCENGAASFEALKVQAIAARSYLYYRLDRTGDIDDGTGDQVYSCGRTPSIQHMMAAEATAGQVLQYQGTQVAAFYVAGAKQTAPSCMGGTDDPTNTERYVTYNEGRSGDAIDQTTLGFVNPANLANRGCMSQNGSDCLSDDGRLTDEILRFYYGTDIEVVQAVGACVATPDPPDASVPDEVDAGTGGNGDGDAGGGCGCNSQTGGGAATGWLMVLALVVVCRRRVG
jgi:MYXO-CTERM domain-containing protein